MTVLPPLNALRVFEVCSRRPSFTQAGRELAITQSAVSRQIALLEDHLQTRLFERRGRQVTLTRRGELLAESVQQIFAGLELATDEIRQRPERQVVRILLFPTVAARWFMPRMHVFHAANPDIDLEIRTSALPTDADCMEVDMFNVRGPINDPRFDYQAIFNIELRPVCSPKLMEKNRLRRPEDLRSHVILHSLNRFTDWETWLERAGVPDLVLPRSLEFDNTALACQAALNSLGVAMGIGDILGEDIATGRLAEPFDLSVRTGETYGLAWRCDREFKPHLARIRDWIRGQVAQTVQEPADAL